jgi:Uma2 family endonuclease
MTSMRAGIPEYWIVRPTNRTIEILILENGEYYSSGIFRGEQLLSSRIVPELPVRVEQFFL